VVGAGAAGLGCAIFTARAAAHLRIVCLDGARTIGAKILVSGGSRCNVTNRVVTERDFWGGPSRVVRHALRAFPAERAAAFFTELGVALHEEEDGKLFPDSNRSRTVLDALLAEAKRLRIDIRAGERVTALVPSAVPTAGHEFSVATATGRSYAARAVVLATGGRSLPKTGSDGFGYELARIVGHRLTVTTPALAPLLLDGTRHATLAGVSHRAALKLRVAGKLQTVLEGSMLWTHFGISGPAALNLSRHWHRAALDRAGIEVLLNLFPGEEFDGVDAWLVEEAASRPKALVNTVLATRLPSAIGDAWAAAAGLDGVTMAHLAREDRRALVHGLVEMPLAVRGSRGYSFAEVTAGGIPLEEIDHARMMSRVCPNLYLVGEILDVDGRLGGFNFQWAWSSAWVAAQSLARTL
jgi:predicted Rossmann fold flavoprotein